MVNEIYRNQEKKQEENLKPESTSMKETHTVTTKEQQLIQSLRKNEDSGIIAIVLRSMGALTEHRVLSHLLRLHPHLHLPSYQDGVVTKHDHKFLRHIGSWKKQDITMVPFTARLTTFERRNQTNSTPTYLELLLHYLFPLDGS